MKIKKFLLPVLCFLLGLMLMYFYSRTELTSNKRITAKILNNCIDSFQASNTLINSCSEAYKTFGSCILDLENCNMQESARKLEVLNKQREQAEVQIGNTTREMGEIVNEVKKTQSH